MKIPLTFLCSDLNVIDVFIPSRLSRSNSIFVRSSLLWPNKQRLFSETSPTEFVSALHVNLLVSKSFPSGLLPKSDASAGSIREQETQASSDLSLPELCNEVQYCSSKYPSLFWLLSNTKVRTEDNFDNIVGQKWKIFFSLLQHVTNIN